MDRRIVKGNLEFLPPLRPVDQCSSVQVVNLDYRVLLGDVEPDFQRFGVELFAGEQPGWWHAV